MAADMTKVVLDLGGGVTEEITPPVQNENVKQQHFIYGGKSWAHKSEDESGRWVYRAD